MGTRLVLVDDHRLVRDALALMMGRESDFEIVGLASDGAAALHMARQLQPDVMVTDLSMPGMNGIEAIRRVRSEVPAVQVLCLSVHDEDRLVLASIDAGASGYVLKDASFEELALAIRQVMDKRIYLSPALSGVMVRAYRERRSRAAAPESTPYTTLTPRERELVQLFSEGHTANEIALRLHVSPKTVATHRENILHKLGIHGMAELTRYALREGLSTLDAPCRAGPLN